MNNLDDSGRRGNDIPAKILSESFLNPDQDRKDIVGFGQYLRRERELRKIPLEEIARVTRINHHYLEALEEGREEDLPALPFVKGFLTAYAKHIGLNPDEVLTYFDEVRMAINVEKPEPVGGDRSQGKKILIFFGIIIIVLTAVFLNHMNKRRVAEDTSPEAARDYPAASDPFYGSGDGSQAVETDVAASAEDDRQEEQMPVSSAAEQGGVLLDLEAVEKTWIYAVIDEKDIKDLFLQPGEKVGFSAKRDINLTLGNAGGVKVTFNGRDLGLLGQSNEVKRDILFTWDPERGAEKTDTFTRQEDDVN